ncbi:HTH cro/C1-type domain-containing protein [uncultured Gammaproteobacteria bacterium]
MKPTIKQISDLHAKIVDSRERADLSLAEISKMAGVHPSQVSRICAGRFKTFSNNVMQICTVLDVSVPQLESGAVETDPRWAEAQSSMRRIWEEAPGGAGAIVRLLKAIEDLQVAHEDGR